MENLEKELTIFLKYIKKEHTDQYGHLEVWDDGDEFHPSFDRVVNDYIKLKQKQK